MPDSDQLQAVISCTDTTKLYLVSGLAVDYAPNSYAPERNYAPNKFLIGSGCVFLDKILITPIKTNYSPIKINYAPIKIKYAHIQTNYAPQTITTPLKLLRFPSVPMLLLKTYQKISNLLIHASFLF